MKKISKTNLLNTNLEKGKYSENTFWDLSFRQVALVSLLCVSVWLPQWASAQYTEGPYNDRFVINRDGNNTNYEGILGLRTNSFNWQLRATTGKDLKFGFDNTYSGSDHDGSGAATKMTLTDGGSLGIGTTSPDTKLSVIGKVRGAKSSSETEYVEIFHGGSHGYINTVGDGNLDFRHDGNTKMSLTSSGKLGIGTDNPEFDLHLQGEGTADDARFMVETTGGTFGPQLRLKHDGTGGREWLLISGGSANTGAGGAGVFAIKDETQGVRMVIDPNGNMGIGTNSPGEKLDVIGTVKATQFIGDASGLTNLPPTSPIWSETFGDTYRDTGFVGIGTNAPEATLHVNGDVKFENLSGAGNHLSIDENGMVTRSDASLMTHVETRNMHLRDEGTGPDITTGTNTTLFGVGAGSSHLTNRDGNTFIGANAGGNYEGDRNTFLGAHSGSFDNLPSGSDNIYIGFNSGINATSGSKNTVVGAYPEGTVSQTFNNSVMIGYQAGSNETESDRLHIANNKDKTLIYGRFEEEGYVRIGHDDGNKNDTLDIMGSLKISGKKVINENGEWVGNIAGLAGEDGASAYQVWLDAGNTGTVQQFLEGLEGQSGNDGKSAYDVWVDAGNTGTVQQFLESLEGQSGNDGKSAYDVWLDAGNTGTVQQFLESLEGQSGNDGKSAYDVWVDAGNTGTVQQFLESLESQSGNDGKSAYDVWVDAGNTGTVQQFLEGLEGQSGNDGKSAYDVWVDAGNTGTVQQFLEGLEGQSGNDGKSAYDVWVDTGNTGTVQQFLEGLEGQSGNDGKSAYDVWVDAGNTGTVQQFLESLKGEKGDNGEDADNTLASGFTGGISGFFGGIAGSSLFNGITDQNAQSDVMTIFDNINDKIDIWSTIENSEDIYRNNGNVGIGMNSPDVKLHVSDTIKIESMNSPALVFESSNTHYDMFIEMGTFKIKASNNNIPALVVDPVGNVAIGTTDIGENEESEKYKLSVNGEIRAKAITVESEWADYVFEEGYELKPLEEVAQYIDKYKHLPGIPAARTVQEKGLDLGEMQTKMMEKIEELTLYLIDMKQENDDLRKKVEILEKAGQ